MAFEGVTRSFLKVRPGGVTGRPVCPRGISGQAYGERNDSNVERPAKHCRGPASPVVEDHRSGFDHGVRGLWPGKPGDQRQRGRDLRLRAALAAGIGRSGHGRLHDDVGPGGRDRRRQPFFHAGPRGQPSLRGASGDRAVPDLRVVSVFKQPRRGARRQRLCSGTLQPRFTDRRCGPAQRHLDPLHVPRAIRVQDPRERHEVHGRARAAVLSGQPAGRPPQPAWRFERARARHSERAFPGCPEDRGRQHQRPTGADCLAHGDDVFGGGRVFSGQPGA